ncbi:MAG TPA: putative zinc-binding metallopeptidase [Gammaproteobacteria bacterium]
MAVRKRPRIGSLSEERLLDLRLCDLGLHIEGTWLEERIEKLGDELAARDIRIRPHCWLSDEWFSPDGITGIAIPFYLAHPRLIRLERKHILEVEGATPAGCMKLLRHEMGHVVDHAYRLHGRRRWQRTFGRSSQRYPDYYKPNPASKRFVVHLDHWYAQAHPDEDFAETFAVWLTPGSRWRYRYRGWPALKKLELVDEMMRGIARRPPEVRSRRKVDTIGRLRMTLREYYEGKRARYRSVTTNIYDEDLIRLFRGSSPRGHESAARFLRTHRVRIRKMVARSTGEHPLALDTVLKEMIDRCRELKLRVSGSHRQLLIDLAILLAARSVEYVYRRKDWHVV